jgi:hypothetical protein
MKESGGIRVEPLWLETALTARGKNTMYKADWHAQNSLPAYSLARD